MHSSKTTIKCYFFDKKVVFSNLLQNEWVYKKSSFKTDITHGDSATFKVNTNFLPCVVFKIRQFFKI